VRVEGGVKRAATSRRKQTETPRFADVGRARNRSRQAPKWRK
jgi:hypothetical protein